jgi:hypothetical protein
VLVNVRDDSLLTSKVGLSHELHFRKLGIDP